MLEFFQSEKFFTQLQYLLGNLPFAIWETVYSTVLATVFAYLIGLPLGILLVTGEKSGIRPLPSPLMRLLNVVINLLLHSLSPHGRRLVEQIATGDPYDVDVKLDSKAKNRSAEILNTRLKTMGYSLVFSKTKKVKKYAILEPAVEFGGNSPDSKIQAVEIMEPGYDFEHYYKTMAEIDELKKKMAISIPAVTFINDMDTVPVD